MPKIYAKVYRKPGEILVAACDESIIGLTFSENEISIEIKKEFYGGELIETEKLVSLLSEATIANLTGNHTVNTAIKYGFIDRNNVLEISGVKHAPDDKDLVSEIHRENLIGLIRAQHALMRQIIRI